MTLEFKIFLVIYFLYCCFVKYSLALKAIIEPTHKIPYLLLKFWKAISFSLSFKSIIQRFFYIFLFNLTGKKPFNFVHIFSNFKEWIYLQFLWFTYIDISSNRSKIICYSCALSIANLPDIRLPCYTIYLIRNCFYDISVQSVQ